MTSIEAAVDSDMPTGKGAQEEAAAAGSRWVTPGYDPETSAGGRSGEKENEGLYRGSGTSRC